MLYLLTGEIECGKTTWLKSLIEQAVERGIAVDGIITPAVFTDGQKTHIDCVLLPEGHVLRFAHRFDVDPGDDEVYDTSLPLRWIFHDKTMAAANAHLAHITPEHPSEHLLLLDELGFVEFQESRGFTEAMRILDQGCYHDAIAVIRPLLMEPALERFTQAAGGEDHIKVIEPGYPYFPSID